jgi:hypothetical protein
MKKLVMAAFMIVAISGVAMSQVSPAKKHTQTKTSEVKKSDSTATSTGVHKMSKKKGHAAKPS